MAIKLTCHLPGKRHIARGPPNIHFLLGVMAEQGDSWRERPRPGGQTSVETLQLGASVIANTDDHTSQTTALLSRELNGKHLESQVF